MSAGSISKGLCRHHLCRIGNSTIDYRTKQKKIPAYVVGPLQFVERRIGSNVTFDVEVVAFLDVVAVDVAAQCDAHFGWILIDRIV